ncbi:hypothetical protein BC830DRAFT_142705 [Chytriomyces sp. MP71]|nr:hypothetical protein BC830DRAFT_142705 [Chytriomyces sp. MP71]
MTKADRKRVANSPVIVSLVLALVALGLAIAATAYADFYSFRYSVQPFGSLTEEAGLFRSQVCQQGSCVVYAGDLCTILYDRGDSKQYPECGEMLALRIVMVISDVIVFLALASLAHQARNQLHWMRPVILGALAMGALFLIASMAVAIHLKSQPLFTISSDTSDINFGVSFYLLVASAIVALMSVGWTFYIRHHLGPAAGPGATAQ